MKRKLWALLLGLTIAIALISFNGGDLSSPAIAQSPPAEFSLEPMSIDRLDAILRSQIEDVSARSGQWQFSLNDARILVLADANSNRMRIFTPVTNAEELTPEQVHKMMLANFHTALDARYAIADGFVVSTFIHPLSSLQESDLLSAINQVSSLAATFGTSYTSGEMLFVPRGDRNNPPSLEQLSPNDVSA